METDIDRYAIAAEMFQSQPAGFPVDTDIDLRAIKLPEDDDMGIQSDDDAEVEEIQTESGMQACIGELPGGYLYPVSLDIRFRSLIRFWPFFAVVSNLPQVGPEKKEKLETIVRKIYSQIGNIRDGECLVRETLK